MIFKRWRQVLDGTKTQTRRPVKPSDWAEGAPGYTARPGTPISAIYDWGERTRLKWAVGGDYAVQPGRGKKSVGRIRITKIRREKLQDISDKDCKAEGIGRSLLYGMDYIPGHQRLGDDRSWTKEQRVRHPQGSFALLWDECYPKEHNWLDNPDVWVLDFELVEREDE